MKPLVQYSLLDVILFFLLHVDTNFMNKIVLIAIWKSNSLFYIVSINKKLPILCPKKFLCVSVSAHLVFSLTGYFLLWVIKEATSYHCMHIKALLFRLIRSTFDLHGSFLLPQLIFSSTPASLISTNQCMHCCNLQLA